MTDIAWYAVLVLAGFMAGIVNTIAGGGSFLTLPDIDAIWFGSQSCQRNQPSSGAVLKCIGCRDVP